jgi:hypothetical protein
MFYILQQGSRTMSKNKKFSNYWKNNLALGIQRAWEWLGVRGIIIDIIISVIVGLLIAQSAENRLGIIQTAGITLAIALVIYILLVLVFIVFIVPYQESQRLEKIISNYKKKGKEPQEFQKLAELRTEGVKLRNFGTGLTDPDSLSKWINDYTEWDTTVIKALESFQRHKQVGLQRSTECHYMHSQMS